MGECGSMLLLVLFAVALLTSPLGVTAACYFATEMQGEYITQNTVTHMNQVTYSHVNITEDSIPIWGLCHRRIGNNIVLRMDSDETSCYNCFHVNLVSRNVLSIHIAEPDYGYRCYTNEEKAIASCLTDGMVEDQPKQKEIILYKILEYNGEQIKRQYCPFNGHYRLMLTIDDGGPETTGCLDSSTSEMDNCPSGSALNVRFRQCTFRDYEPTLECLGQWKGHDNQNFIAFMNTGNQSFGPTYRCATFVKDPDTNVITISLSADSLCSTHDMYARNEILELYPIKNHSFEPPIHQYQRLPAWMQGEFEFLTIDDEQIVYRDQSSFKTYTMKCIAYYNTAAIDESTTARLLTFSRTQCGEGQFHCLAIHKRSANVLEFQIGNKIVHHSSLNDLGDIESICGDKHFDKSHVMTQARLDNTFEQSPCPIDGEFIGLIPDAEDLCARLWSDCGKNDTMNYQVSFCGHDEIFDERKYQCIGQWTENNIIYTYAKRLDVPTYECFLGALASSEEIFIKEAGEHCRRDIDPYRYSMQLNKTQACPKIEAKIESPTLREYEEKEKSTSTVSPDERAPPNGEVEYEYFDDNHLNINLNGNVVSSTESRLQIHVKESGENLNSVDDKMTNDSFHPIHPKMNLGSTTKIDSKTTTHNRSCTKFSDLALIYALLLLPFLLPNLLIHS